MLFPKKLLSYFQKRASKNKRPQTKLETVDQCADDDERKGDAPRMPPKGPEHFIPFPKR